MQGQAFNMIPQSLPKNVSHSAERLVTKLSFLNDQNRDVMWPILLRKLNQVWLNWHSQLNKGSFTQLSFTEIVPFHYDISSSDEQPEQRKMAHTSL